MAHTIYLVRHGQVHNPHGVRYRRLPGYRLSHRGWQEAHQARRFLQDEPIERLDHSPLERAHETAQIINQCHGAPIQASDLLHEWDPAENFVHVAHRVREFYDRLLRQGGGAAVVVGHRDPLRMLVLSLKGQVTDANARDVDHVVPLPTGGIYRIQPRLDPHYGIELVFQPK